MPNARILDLCDAIATLIGATWVPVAPDAVSREYGPDVGLSEDDGNTLLDGRQVYVFPIGYGVPAMDDRTFLDKRYAVVVTIIERYTDDPGIPPNDWMDTRVTFTETLFKLLRNPFLELLAVSGAYVMPDIENPATVDAVYDFDLFQENRTFRSQMTLNFQEAAAL